MLYVLGLRSKTDGARIVVGPGRARDSADAIDLVLDETLALDVTGLQASTAHALYVVKHPQQPPELVASLHFDGLSGAFAWRRIGSFATGPRGNVVPFVQYGTSNDRQVEYHAPPALLRVVNDGNATRFRTIDCQPLLHPRSERALVRVAPNGGAVSIRARAGATEHTTTTTQSFPLGFPNEAWRIDFKVDAPDTTTDLYILGTSEVI